MPKYRGSLTDCELYHRALQYLEGVGDAARGEWTEMHDALHLRRRLSAAEQARVGHVRDLRQTAEGWKRWNKARAHVPVQAHPLALEELHERPA